MQNCCHKHRSENRRRRWARYIRITNYSVGTRIVAWLYQTDSARARIRIASSGIRSRCKRHVERVARVERDGVGGGTSEIRICDVTTNLGAVGTGDRRLVVVDTIVGQIVGKNIVEQIESSCCIAAVGDVNCPGPRIWESDDAGWAMGFGGSQASRGWC